VPRVQSSRYRQAQVRVRPRSSISEVVSPRQSPRFPSATQKYPLQIKLSSRYKAQMAVAVPWYRKRFRLENDSIAAGASTRSSSGLRNV